jgi:Predicted hydrolases or acyltransferases (alpha/beta hydrolase superfamily)
MAGASGTQTVAAADGRTLTIAECGDPDGFPVFLLHGTPGSRFGGQGLASSYASVGARVITYDRPGYGGSDRFRGRRVGTASLTFPRSQTASVSSGSP